MVHDVEEEGGGQYVLSDHLFEWLHGQLMKGYWAGRVAAELTTKLIGLGTLVAYTSTYRSQRGTLVV